MQCDSYQLWLFKVYVVVSLVYIIFFIVVCNGVYCQCVNEFETKEQKLILSEGKFEQQNNHIKAKWYCNSLSLCRCFTLSV